MRAGEGGGSAAAWSRVRGPGTWSPQWQGRTPRRAAALPGPHIPSACPSSPRVAARLRSESRPFPSPGPSPLSSVATATSLLPPPCSALGTAGLSSLTSFGERHVSGIIQRVTPGDRPFTLAKSPGQLPRLSHVSPFPCGTESRSGVRMGCSLPPPASSHAGSSSRLYSLKGNR